MHDNAPVHTAGAVQATLDELGMEVRAWPPHSSNFNPIENLEVLKQAPNTAASKEFLIEAAKEAWYRLGDRILVRLSETMPNCVQVVINVDGWCISIGYKTSKIVGRLEPAQSR